MVLGALVDCSIVRINVRYGAAHFGGFDMQSFTASEARANLYRLVDQTAESHQPITITGKRNSAVLLSAEDWSAIQETLFLLSIPGMRESIKDGMAQSVASCSERLNW